MSYPEHDKLRAVKDQSQAQGELLEWLAAVKGARLMVWTTFTDTDECSRCVDWSDQGRARVAARDLDGIGCDRCKDTRTVTTTREQWAPVAPGNIQDLLAEFHGIDLLKLEAEKRAMLATP